MESSFFSQSTFCWFSFVPRIHQFYENIIRFVILRGSPNLTLSLSIFGYGFLSFIYYLPPHRFFASNELWHNDEKKSLKMQTNGK